MTKRSGLAAAGFTAIEVVMAIALLVLVMSVAYSSLQQIIRSKQVLDRTRDSRKVADSVLTRIVRELQLAYNGRGGLMPPPDDLKNLPSERIKLIGTPNDVDGRPGDRLMFLAQEAGQYMPDGGRHSGVVQIAYRLEEDPDAPGTQSRVLVREETPYSRPFDRAYKYTMIFPVSRDIAALAFRYYDATEERWYNSWGDENRVNLPAIVQLSVTVRAPDGSEQTLTTAVPLRAKS